MSGSPKRETISPKWRDFHGLFARPSQSWSGDRTGMSKANVEIIRRHYEREAEAFRGGDVRAFLEEF